MQDIVLVADKDEIGTTLVTHAHLVRLLSQQFDAQVHQATALVKLGRSEEALKHEQQLLDLGAAEGLDSSVQSGCVKNAVLCLIRCAVGRHTM